MIWYQDSWYSSFKKILCLSSQQPVATQVDYLAFIIQISYLIFIRCSLPYRLIEHHQTTDKKGPTSWQPWMILILLCLAKPWLIVIIFGIFLWAEYYKEMNCPVQKYCDSHQFVSVYIFSDATPHRLIVAIVFHNKNNAVGHCSLSWLFYFIINYYSFNAALYNTPWPILHCHIGWLLVVCFSITCNKPTLQWQSRMILYFFFVLYSANPKKPTLWWQSRMIFNIF